MEHYCLSKHIPLMLLLLIDNAPGHPPATLTDFDPSVKEAFLSPNSIDLLQPMTILKTFEAHYTKLLETI